MPGTTKSEGALLSALFTHARCFCNATQGCRMRIILFKTFPNGEGAALRMTWVNMTSQSVKELRPCSQFDCCGDRMPRRQRHAQSIGSRHEVSGCQRSEFPLHTLSKSLEVVMVSQAQLAACSGEMQQGCGQQNRQETEGNNRANTAIGRLRGLLSCAIPQARALSTITSSPHNPIKTVAFPTSTMEGYSHRESMYCQCG